MKQKIITLLLITFLATQVVGKNNQALAATSGSVVINEIAWAGSVDNANDEWIELYNTTNQSLNLTGWTINDDQGGSLYNLSGNIDAHGYYLIEDSENSVTPQIANAIINLSLANTGDSLVLSDNNGQVIDSVNSSGGAWSAGNTTTKATMERINGTVSGDIATNWGTNTQSSGSQSSGGSGILGTPGKVNSLTINVVSTSEKIFLEGPSSTPNVNEIITMKGKIQGSPGLVSYGLEVEYDSTVFELIGASKGPFLSENESKDTSFQAALENGIPGKLLLAEAITDTNKTGTTGSGELFEIELKVLKNNQASDLIFGPSSFSAGENGDLTLNFEGITMFEGTVETLPITNALATSGNERYSIKLSWDQPTTGADSYKIYRRSALMQWTLLEEVPDSAANFFIDSDQGTVGGKIIPSIDYHYQVVAVKNGVESSTVEIIGQDNRGLKGDNDRSDRVDGRDLERLAKHFGQTSSDPSFEVLIDTNYDAQIDGSDLIDLGLNFAKTYS